MLTAVEIAKAKALKLSNNFSLHELIDSDSKPGLVAWPDENTINALRKFACEVLQPIRGEFGKVNVNSGYRNAKLNKAVGGVSNSIHMIYVNGKFTGVASDITADNEKDLVKIMAFIAKRVPAAKRVIIYRRLKELKINSAFLHVDSDIKVNDNARPVLLEKVAKNAYVSFDKSELEKYDY